jgi:stage III sporulation protein AG
MKQIKNLINGRGLGVLLYIILGLGAVLMLLPNSKETDTPVSEVNEVSYNDTEDKMEELLSCVEGAGEVKVMITYKNNGSVELAKDVSSDKDKERTSDKSNVVMGSDNKPVVLAENTPRIEGVVIVARGGDNIEVKDSLIRAAQALLGVEVNKIEVLKMKVEE